MESLKNDRLLVIGGTGFIGYHLLKLATKEGLIATSISLNHPTTQRKVESVKYIELDITRKNLLRNNLIEGFEYVVNLGGYIDHKLFKNGGGSVIEAHFNGLLNLIEFLPRETLKRFIQIGSSDEYGNEKAPQHEDLRENPISPYSLAKAANTHFLQMLHRTENFTIVILRLFLVYGPFQDKKRFLPQIINGCLNDKIFPASEGHQLRDFCFVEDVVAAILSALHRKEAIGEIINIASGKPYKIRSIIELVKLLIRKGQPNYGQLAYRHEENMELYAEIKKAKKLLGWSPRVTINDGLELTINSFKQTNEK